MSARGVALRALTLLDSGKVERIRETLERARLDRRDRAFAWDLAHGVVRNERLLDFVLSTVAHRGLPKDPTVLAALRLGAYQLLLVDGMPQRAAVYETVALVRRNQAFVNASLRRVAEMVVSRPADPLRQLVEIPLSTSRTLVLPGQGLGTAAEPLAVRHSLPDFLLARWRRAYGDQGAAEAAQAASAVPGLFLRAAGGRTAAALVTALEEEEVECRVAAVSGLDDVVECLGGASPFQSRAFSEGWFFAQDPTAARAAAAVAAQAGERIVDLCAAPGTKTMALAQAVREDGVVYAFDVDARRRLRIVENTSRLQLEPWVRIVERAADLPRDVDAVLVDAPCSNSGVLARRVEVRRRLRETTSAAMAAVQEELLRQAIGLVRPGGRVVYSTCSIDPEENGELVAGLVAAGGVTREREALTLPAAGRCDGGYFAVLRVDT